MTRHYCRFLGLLATVVTFADILPAQSTCANPLATPVFIRNEGAAELVGDLTLTCTGSGGPATIRVFLSPALPVTSAVLSTGNPIPVAPIYTEALIITGSSQVQGVVDSSGASITFADVVIPSAVAPATTSLRITNIRVNATGAVAGSGFSSPITESMFISGAGVVRALLGPVTVGLVVRGFGTQSITNVSLGPSPFGSPGNGQPGTLVGCVALKPALPAFFIKFGESLNTAFRQRGSALSNATPGAWTGLNTETGYTPALWPNTPGASNLANSATRIKIVLTNLPQNALVYFPTSPGTDVAGAGTLALTGSETGAFGAYSPVTPDSTNNLPSGPGAPGLALIGSGGGTVTAVYEVTSQSAAIESYTVPVYLAWAAGTVNGTDAPIGVSISFAPTGSVNNIPNFAVGGSTTPLTAPTVTSCFTSLLFPFVTNELGFDTAIAISNTSFDPFGAVGAPAQSGTCNLNLYGVGAPTPNTNVLAPNGLGPGGALVSGQSSVFLLSDVAAGFQGYMIVACNFQYAHGFASITSNFGQPNGTAMGYMGLVLAGRGRGTIVDSMGN